MTSMTFAKIEEVTAELHRDNEADRYEELAREVHEIDGQIAVARLVALKSRQLANSANPSTLDLLNALYGAADAIESLTEG